MDKNDDMITKEQMQNLLDVPNKRGISYKEATSILLATIGLKWNDNID